MTDGRFPDRWLSDRRVASLSADAFRLFVVANTWSASNKTDGKITRADLDTFPRWVSTATTHLCELHANDLWIATDDGYVIRDYAGVQTTAAELKAIDRNREAARLRKAKERALKAEAEAKSAAQEHVTRDVTPPVAPDVTADYTGKARTGVGEGSTSRTHTRENKDHEGEKNFGRGVESDKPPAKREAPWCPHLQPPGECDICTPWDDLANQDDPWSSNVRPIRPA